LESAQQELDEIKPTDEQIRDAFFNSLIEGIDTDATGAEITETLKTEKLAEAENKRGRKKTVAEEEYSADTYFDACRSYVNALNRVSSSELTELYQKMGYTMESVMKLMGADESIVDYNLKRKIMTAAVAYSRKVTVTQEEYDIYMNALASLYGYSDGNTFFEAVGKKFGQRFFVDAIIEAKVMDYLYSVSHVDLS
jgi:FKBP-type peptidyl-prolyl cis-trans isomerase (trigger factor)